MSKRIGLLAMLLSAAVSPPALAALDVFACEPEWAALAREVGGDKVSVYVATTARQNPHRIEARPSLIAQARNADLVVCTGAELEVGWLPLVLNQSGNAKVQPAAPGYFEATRYVKLREVPTSIDRVQGDVHAAGNPHIHLDPRNIAAVAAALSERMKQLDPPEAATYAARAQTFLDRWRQATTRWEQQAKPLAGMPVVVHHRDLSYLIAWLGMREVATLEPKPGLPASASHLGSLLVLLDKQPAEAVLRSAYNDPRPSEWLAERAKVLAVLLPFTVGGTEAAKDLFSLYDDTLARLLAVER